MTKAQTKAEWKMCIHYQIAGTYEEVLCNVMKDFPRHVKESTFVTAT
jgi:hypothetical protein